MLRYKYDTNLKHLKVLLDNKTGMNTELAFLSDHCSELTDPDEQEFYGAVDCYLNNICIGNVGFYWLHDGSIKLTEWNYNE